MANRTATLLRYARLNDLGWRRGTLAQHKNGRHNPAAMIYDGVEYGIPADSHYQIRHYVGKKTVYTPAGTDYEAALALLNKYEASRMLELSQKALGIHVPENEAPKTLADQVAAYVQKKKSPLLKLSTASIHLYESTLTGFAAHCKRQYASEVTEGDILSYLESLKIDGYAEHKWLKQTDGSTVRTDGPRKGYSDKSITMRYITIRGFLKSCGVNIERVIQADVHKRLSTKPEPNVEPFADDQITRLLAVCDEYHRAVFQFLLGSGVREQEAAHLLWTNVDFARNQIFIPGKQSVNREHRGESKQINFQSKNRKGRYIPMFASVRALLIGWRKKNPATIYVFGSRRSDLPSNHFIEYLKKYWVAADLGDTDEAYLHRFRHTFARKALDAGVPIDVVSKSMGHHSLEVTKIYLSGTKATHLDPFAALVAA